MCASQLEIFFSYNRGIVVIGVNDFGMVPYESYSKGVNAFIMIPKILR